MNHIYARLKSLLRIFDNLKGQLLYLLLLVGLISTAFAQTPQTRTNVALHANGGVATASSVRGSAYGPASANNGERKGAVWDAGGGWQDGTSGVFPDWLQINFNASKTIDEIDVYSIQDNFSNPVEPTATSTFTLYGLSAFDVQYWNGTTWVTVSGGSISNNNLVWRKINFPAVTTDRIRVLVNSGLNSYSRIAEVEAYTVSSGNVPPSVSLTAPANNASYTAPANITLEANASDSDGTIDRVEFYNGTTLLNTDTSPPYSYNWIGVSAGVYTLTAKAYDNASASTVSTVVNVTVNAANVAPSVSLTAPTNNATYTAPATITLDATAADSDGTITKVEFYNGAVLLNTDISAPYSYQWTGVATGSYTLTAKTTDDKGASTTSSAVSISVNASTSITPPINYAYDEIGRLTGMFDAVGNSVQFAYDPVGNLLLTTRKSAGAVTILEFTPEAAVVGEAVTITGTGFSNTPNQNSVIFNGTAATVASATTNTLVVTVPAGATSGPISVTSPSGTATSDSNFNVSMPGSGTSAPTIASVTPTIGGAGTNITITGTGFQSNTTYNKVTINGRALKVTAATATSLTGVIPTSGGSGQSEIKITTRYGSATSMGDFYFLPSPYIASDVEVATRMENPSSKTITISTAGKVALVLFDAVAGHNLSLTWRDSTFASFPNSQITVYDTSGVWFASVDFNGGGLRSGSLPLVIPFTGTYMVLVSTSGGGTGQVTLSLAPDAVGTVAVDGSTTNVTLAAGQLGRYSFTGTMGQTLGLGVNGLITTPEGWGVNVSMLTPDGNTWLNFGSPFVDSSFDPLALPMGGTYTVLVGPSEGSSAAILSLTLSNDIAGTMTPGNPLGFNTSRAGQNARFTFAGTAGQNLTLSWSGSTFDPWSYIYVFKPDGLQLTNTEFFNWDGALPLPVLPVSGTYTVFVTPAGGSIGQVTLTVQ